MGKLKVIFRKCNEEIVAFLPELKVNYGNIVCYAHVGQHSEASYDYYIESKQCTENEYNSLMEELKHIYSDCVLVVKKRLYYKDLIKAWDMRKLYE